MARNRASEGKKLSSVTIIERHHHAPPEVSELREYVTHVEYRVSYARYIWDEVPGEKSG